MSAIDDSLVTLADSSNVPWIEDTYNRIFASQAYCRNGAVVYIDMRESPYKVSFMGSEIFRGYILSTWHERVDPSITLLDSEGKELVFFDPSPFLRVGDFMKVWIAEDRPQFCLFYDPVTGLAIAIEHLDGSTEIGK
jgi:hypothetical protein